MQIACCNTLYFTTGFTSQCFSRLRAALFYVSSDRRHGALAKQARLEALASRFSAPSGEDANLFRRRGGTGARELSVLTTVDFCRSEVPASTPRWTLPGSRPIRHDLHAGAHVACEPMPRLVAVTSDAGINPHRQHLTNPSPGHTSCESPFAAAHEAVASTAMQVRLLTDLRAAPGSFAPALGHAHSQTPGCAPARAAILSRFLFAGALAGSLRKQTALAGFGKLPPG